LPPLKMVSILQKGGFTVSKALPLTDADYSSEIEKSDLPVLVDFWASWCGPCRMMGPVIDTVADEYEGKVKVMKCNVDENPATPAKFGIRGIPTLILFNKGEVVNTLVGAAPKGEVDGLLKSVVA
jgi:thioredoxin 1